MCKLCVCASLCLQEGLCYWSQACSHIGKHITQHRHGVRAYPFLLRLSYLCLSCTHSPCVCLRCVGRRARTDTYRHTSLACLVVPLFFYLSVHLSIMICFLTRLLHWLRSRYMSLISRVAAVISCFDPHLLVSVLRVISLSMYCLCLCVFASSLFNASSYSPRFLLLDPPLLILYTTTAGADAAAICVFTV